MAVLIIAFLLLMLWIFLRSVNKMFNIVFRAPKKVIPFIHKTEELKAPPVPTVTNIQNNYNTTQILIIESSKE